MKVDKEGRERGNWESKRIKQPAVPDWVLLVEQIVEGV